MFKKQIKRHKKYYWFTLVELIIVITILAILTTISFVSFSWYTANSRDSKRLFTIWEIVKSLTIQKELTWKFPVPDNIFATGWIQALNSDLFNVWEIWDGVSRFLKFWQTPKDPSINWNYLYWLTNDNRYFQVAWTMESWELTYLVPTAYANWNLKAIVDWNYRWVLKFNHNNKSYIWRIPSLIFSRDWTHEWTDKVFVLNNEANLPYKVNENNLWSPKILTSTWVEITSSLNVDDLVQNDDWKDIPKEIIEEEITGKPNAWGWLTSGGGWSSWWGWNSGWGWTPPVVVIPTVDWECWSSNNQSLSVSPTDNLCNKWTASEVSGTWPWTWTCSWEWTTQWNDASCSATKAITCPTWYVWVPWNSTFTTNDFCVAKYEMKNVWWVATSQASWTPWVNITQPDAIKECNDLWAWYHLITNNEWMTIARNIEWNWDNWSGWSVWNWYIYSWHNDGSPNNSLSASTNDTDGYNQTWNSIWNQKRTHTLSNWQVIWDLAWNVWEHVNGTNDISHTNWIVADWNACWNTWWYSWNTCSYTNTSPMFYSRDNYWPAWNYNEAHWVWRLYSNTYTNRIFLRGAHWNAPTTAGIFSLDLWYDAAGASNTLLGFRCAYTPN